jgi:predicted DNA-binding transcriptional regulator AlpA
VNLTQEEILKATPDAARKMLAEVSSVLPLLVAKASEQPSTQPAPAAAQNAPGPLLTAKQLQERLHVSRATLFRLRERDGFPAADYRLGQRSPRWAEAEIIAWEQRQ